MKISKDWIPFEAQLAEALAVLEEDHFLILSHPDTGHFVQFSAQGRYGLRGEARSNIYIQPARQLGPDLERRLIELGWKAPTHQRGGEDSDPDGSPNWFQQWALPVPWAEVSLVAGLTLREVYGVRQPASLRYHAFHSRGTPILLPTLGLRREERPESTGPLYPEWRSELRQAVDRAMLPLLDRYFIIRLEDGDLLTKQPSGYVAVGERENPFRILFYSRLLEDVQGDLDVLKALNERNAALIMGRLYWQDGVVILDHAIPAEPFVPEQFTRVLAEFHALTPVVGVELHEVLGGTLLTGIVPAE